MTPARVALTHVPIWQHVLAVAFALATIFGLVRLGGLPANSAGRPPQPTAAAGQPQTLRTPLVADGPRTVGPVWR